MPFSSDETITIEFDGAAKGNPGPAGAGVVLKAADDTLLAAFGTWVGHATNNVAEYRGLIAGLQAARRLGARNVIVRGDSQLVIRQMTGQYRVKHPALQPLYADARSLARTFDSVQYVHNLRAKNVEADRLANLAITRGADVADA